MTLQNPMEQFALWKRTLGTEASGNPQCIEKLRHSYLSFRERVSYLVADIGTLLPGLTDHSILHLDQLWRIANEIAGSDYLLNPAEAYVLGGAFLLHDSAHVLAAYPEGMDSIRATTEWRDLISQRFDALEPASGSPAEKKRFFSYSVTCTPNRRTNYLQ